MIRRYSVEDIIRQINSAKWSCTDPKMDGFSTWPIKQDLYQIKWAVDAALKDCPNYSGEAEWLKEQEQRQLIKILSKK